MKFPKSSPKNIFEIKPKVLAKHLVNQKWADKDHPKRWTHGCALSDSPVINHILTEFCRRFFFRLMLHLELKFCHVFAMNFLAFQLNYLKLSSYRARIKEVNHANYDRNSCILNTSNNSAASTIIL